MIAYLVFIFVGLLITTDALHRKTEKENRFEKRFKINGIVYQFRQPCSIRKYIKLREMFADGRQLEPLGRFDCTEYWIDNDTFRTRKV